MANSTLPFSKMWLNVICCAAGNAQRDGPRATIVLGKEDRVLREPESPLISLRIDIRSVLLQAVPEVRCHRILGNCRSRVDAADSCAQRERAAGGNRRRIQKLATRQAMGRDHVGGPFVWGRRSEGPR